MMHGKKITHSWMIWLTIFVLFCIAVYVLRSVLLPFVAGIVIGYLLDPWASKFVKWGMSRTCATVLVMFLVVIIAVPAVLMLFGIIDEQLGQFIRAVPNYLASFARKIEPVINELQQRIPSLEPERIRDYIRSNMANSLKLVGNVMRSVITNGFALINILSLVLITPIVAFYMLRDWDTFVAKVDSLLPKQSKKSIEKQAPEIDCILASFIRGQLPVCVLLGTFYAVGLYIVGLV